MAAPQWIAIRAGPAHGDAGKHTGITMLPFDRRAFIAGLGGRQRRG
jgi:hypothetical protein